MATEERNLPEIHLNFMFMGDEIKGSTVALGCTINNMRKN